MSFEFGRSSEFREVPSWQRKIFSEFSEIPNKNIQELLNFAKMPDFELHHVSVPSSWGYKPMECAIAEYTTDNARHFIFANKENVFPLHEEFNSTIAKRKLAQECVENCPSSISRRGLEDKLIRAMQYKEIKEVLADYPSLKYIADSFEELYSPNESLDEIYKIFEAHSPTMKILKEVSLRERAHNEAVAKAKAAQDKYFKLSDSSCGKSAKESAEVFNKHYAKLEAEAREANELALRRAQEVQEIAFRELHAPKKTKSALESARVFHDHYKKINLEAQRRIDYKNSIQRARELEDNYFKSLETPNKSAQESAEAILHAQKIQAEAQARNAQAQGIKRAQKVQEDLFDATYNTTPKSAQESAEVFTNYYKNIENEAKERIAKENSIQRARQVQEDLFDATYNRTPKSAQESAKVFEEYFNQQAELSTKGNDKNIKNIFENSLNYIKKHKTLSALVALSAIVGTSWSIHIHNRKTGPKNKNNSTEQKAI